MAKERILTFLIMVEKVSLDATDAPLAFARAGAGAGPVLSESVSAESGSG
jgi:hypothetical protein